MSFSESAPLEDLPPAGESPQPQDDVATQARLAAYRAVKAVRNSSPKDGGATEDHGVLVDHAVEAIGDTPVKGYWFKVAGDRQNLLLSLAAGGVEASLFVSGPLRGEMKVDFIKVHDSALQAHSIGGRLIRAVTAEAKRAGAHTLVGDLKSEAGIRNRLHTFGADNVHFFEQQPTESGEMGDVEIPLTRDQAIACLRQAQEIDPDALLTVKVNLDDIDTSGWELPAFEEGARRPELSASS